MTSFEPIRAIRRRKQPPALTIAAPQANIADGYKPYHVNFVSNVFLTNS